MRVTCPTCAAAYELPDDHLPAGGSHVQCSSCHTRWFVRARPAEDEPPSEDEIIARLATRAQPAQAAGAPTLRPGGDSAPTPFPPRPPRPASPDTADAPDADTPAARSGPQDLPSPHPLRPEPPAPVAAQPAPRPEIRMEPAPARPAEAPPTPLRPRVSERPSSPPPAAIPAPPARRRGGAAGFLLALALTAAGTAAYLNVDAIVARAPATETPLATFANRIDAMRMWVETRLGPIRDRLGGV
ncbi:zinc-ribbon domain-containing protein [Amaricoccus sp.]|uniref:zinc-ribbon domain-containing protein n=1 Tax=Amaricoccus sp. TaxID=1872485 RepID=UPI001B72F15B|nr:zinc-ribbon domain-containing protein [Amaricoccus sp.]MBP7240488.1 zinc-ribbon domain-containing protein [Amaricoccus sp.]